MRKRTYTAAYRDESRLFYGAIALLVVVFSTYAYFLSSSIVHVVMRKEVDKEISLLGTEVGQLEARYIEMQHSVNTEIAAHQGLVLTSKKIFIDKSVGTLVVSR